MTRPPNETRLRRKLESAWSAVRRALIARQVLRVTSGVALALALAVVGGLLLPATPTTASARLAAVAVAIMAALALGVRGLLRDTPRFAAFLEQVEARFPSVRSWLRNALDLEASPPTHTSAELADALHGETVRRLREVPLETLRPALRARTPLLVSAGAAAVLSASTAFAPSATLQSWRTLWDPGAAAPPVTLAVEPGSVTVSPGAMLAVRARVEGTDAAPRLLGAGASPTAVLESETSGERRWRFDLPPVTQERDYAVRVQRTESPRYHIALAGEPSPVSFRIDLHAPGYARLPVQSGAATRGDISALRGSRAAVEVTFDRDLESLEATVPGRGTVAWTQVTPRRWHGEVAVGSGGEYELRARAASGEARFRYGIQPLDDAPPVIAVAVPERDVDLPTGQLIPYDVIVQDDLGLSELKLQWRKDADAPWRDVPLHAFGEQPREARVAARWDASALSLLPGQAGTFRFEVADNNSVSGRSRVRSAEFQVRFPSIAELYQTLDDRREQVQGTLKQVADQAKELQKSLDKLQQNPQRTGASPSYERAEELKKTVDRQQQLLKQLDAAAQTLQQNVRESEEREAFREELAEKMREMSELLKQIQSEELKRSIEKMKQALEQMDRRQAEQAIPEMQQENRDLLKNLQRSIALLKQLREEEKLDALAKRAEELKEQQDALNREHQERAEAREPDAAKSAKHSPTTDGSKREPSPGERPGDDLAARQEDAAKQSEQLAQEAREAASEMENAQAREDLEQASESLEQEAARMQRQAAQESGGQQSGAARKSGQQASEQLEQAAKRMNQSSQSSQQSRQQVNAAAVRRAAQDLLSLERSADQNLSTPGDTQRRADRQTDLAEGVARVADSLSTLAEKTPFLSPKLQQSLGRAMQGLQSSGREMAQGQRGRGEATGRSAQQALTEAVKELREAESSMCQTPGQGQQGQSGGEKLSQIGEQQSQLNRETRQIARRLSQQLSMQAGDQSELQRLAREQGRIRAQMEALQQEEERKKSLLGRLDQAQREMKDVEEALRSGSPGDDLEEKQTRILSRLLDAQRSMNRRDFDPEREARRADPVARTSAPALPADLLRTNDRLRHDLLKAEADRYPAQYKAFVEAYLRSLNGQPR